MILYDRNDPNMKTSTMRLGDIQQLKVLIAKHPHEPLALRISETSGKMMATLGIGASLVNFPLGQDISVLFDVLDEVAPVLIEASKVPVPSTDYTSMGPSPRAASATSGKKFVTTEERVKKLGIGKAKGLSRNQLVQQITQQSMNDSDPRVSKRGPVACPVCQKMNSTIDGYCSAECMVNHRLEDSYPEMVST